MKKLLIAFLGLAFLASAGTVRAEQAAMDIEFDVATTRADGDILTPAEILEHRFFVGCNTTPSLFLTVPNGGLASTTVDVFDGDTFSVCFSTVDTDGQVGDLSPAYNFTVDLIAQPGAGNIRSITITCTTQRCRITSN